MKSTVWAVITAVGLLAAHSARTQAPCINGFADIYPCENVDLLARMPLADIGGAINTNDVWGWVSPVSGREYALVGASNGTAFVDVSVPTSPVYLGLLPTRTSNSLWRDVETIGNYLVVGSEAPGHGFQIMDLLQLDQVLAPPVEFEEDATYLGFGNSHTLNIDPVSQLAVAFGSNTFNGGPHIVDLSDPLNPVIAGGFPDDGYTHDGFITTYQGPDQEYQGHVILVLCNEDALTIADCTDPADCVLLDTHTYPQTGYVHQGWFSKDYRYFFVNDELDELNFGVGTRTHMFDLQNLSEIVYLGFYQAESPAIDHNLYVKDQFMYQSNYRAGVRIFDVSLIAAAAIHEVAHFDLFPANDNPSFSGTWSNYPFLPSGINLATSMYDGFFILKPRLIDLAQNRFELCGVNQITFNLQVTAELHFPLTVSLEGIPVGASLSAPVINAPGSYQIFLGNLNSVLAGSYSCNLLLSTTFGESYELPVFLQLAPVSGSAPTLSEPSGGSLISDAAPSIAFNWESQPGAVVYVFQLAADNAFTSLIEQQQVSSASYTYPAMLPEGQYFWRVAVINACGTGSWSETFTFGVGYVGINDHNYLSTGVFPNPATEIAMVRWQGESGQIIITDSMGRMCLEQNAVQGQSAVLDIRDLQPGMYLVRAGNQVFRLIKK